MGALPMHNHKCSAEEPFYNRKPENIRNSAKTIDNDIQKLAKTWETPHLLMYGGNVEEASPHVEAFLGELKELQDQLMADRESRMKYITSTHSYISSVENFYDDLRQQCDDIEYMLTDYGYKPLHNDSECLSTAESEADSSILTTSQMENSQSSSDFYDKCETHSFCTPMININRPKSIATPVITSLASVTKLK